MKYAKEVVETNRGIGLRVEFELEISNFAPSPAEFWYSTSHIVQEININFYF